MRITCVLFIGLHLYTFKVLYKHPTSTSLTYMYTLCIHTMSLHRKVYLKPADEDHQELVEGQGHQGGTCV